MEIRGWGFGYSAMKFTDVHPDLCSIFQMKWSKKAPNKCSVSVYICVCVCLCDLKHQFEGHRRWARGSLRVEWLPSLKPSTCLLLLLLLLVVIAWWKSRSHDSSLIVVRMPRIPLLLWRISCISCNPQNVKSKTKARMKKTFLSHFFRKCGRDDTFVCEVQQVWTQNSMKSFNCRFCRVRIWWALECCYACRSGVAVSGWSAVLSVEIRRWVPWRWVSLWNLLILSRNFSLVLWCHGDVSISLWIEA